MSSTVTATAGARAAASPPSSGVVLTQRHIFVLPTRFGWMFAMVLLVMLMGSVNYSNSLGYALTFLLGGIALVGLLHTYFNLAQLEVLPGRSTPVYAGDTARFGVTFRNPSGATRHALALRASDRRRSGKRPRRPAGESVHIDVPGQALADHQVPVPAFRRGWLKLGRVRLTSTYPLGLFRAWSYADLDSVCLVYPRPSGDLPLPGFTGGNYDGALGRQPGQEDFAGFHKYRIGDSPRHIHWKAVARGSEPLVKHFTGSGAQRIELNWDRLSVLADKELRLSQLCAWVLECERLGLSYDLVLPGQRLDYGADDAHRQACLRALAEYP